MAVSVGALRIPKINQVVETENIKPNMGATN
jgi:hypothetical protein